MRWRRLSAVDPRTLSDAAIEAIFEWWRAAGADVMQIVFVMSNMTVRERLLGDICKQVGFPYERLVYPQLAAGARSVSTEQALDLVALADVARGTSRARGVPRGERQLVRALRDGARRHDVSRPVRSVSRRATDIAAATSPTGRCRGSTRIRRRCCSRSASSCAASRWICAPSPSARKPTPRRPARLHRAADGLAAVDGAAAACAACCAAEETYVWREQVRSDLTRIVATLRAWHLTLADRFVERGWIAAARRLLLPAAARGRCGAARSRRMVPALRAIVAARRAELAEQQRDRDADADARVGAAGDLHARGGAAAAEGDSSGVDRATGVATSPACASARARVEARSRRDEGSGRVRVDAARRHSGRAGHRSVVDAAVHAGLRRDRGGRRDAVARVDDRPRIRAARARQREARTRAFCGPAIASGSTHRAAA